MLFCASVFKARQIKFKAGIPRSVYHEIERQSISFVKVEGYTAEQSHAPLIGDRAPDLGDLLLNTDLIFKLGRPCLHDARELPFFRVDNLCDAFDILSQLRISNRHLIAHRVHHLAHKWLLMAQQASMANPPTKDFSQHIPATLI